MWLKVLALASFIFLLIFGTMILVYVFWLEPPSTPPPRTRPVMLTYELQVNHAGLIHHKEINWEQL